MYSLVRKTIGTVVFVGLGIFLYFLMSDQHVFRDVQKSSRSAQTPTLIDAGSEGGDSLGKSSPSMVDGDGFQGRLVRDEESIVVDEEVRDGVYGGQPERIYVSFDDTRSAQKENVRDGGGVAIRYDESTIYERNEYLACKQDGHVLRWRGGGNKWECAKSSEAVFGAIDGETVDVAKTGVMMCRDDNEMVYWDKVSAEWRCGSVGDGIIVPFTALRDVHVDGVTDGALLLYSDNQWRNASVKDALGGRGILAPGASVSIDATTGALSCSNSYDVLQYDDVDQQWDCVNPANIFAQSFLKGSVPFMGDSGLSQDNTQFFWDAIQKRLGIGTKTPEKMLHVSSSSKPTIRVTDTTNNLALDFRAEDTVAFVGTSTNHGLRLMTNGSSRLTVAANGSVGIGTTTPTNALDVVGKMTATEVVSAIQDKGGQVCNVKAYGAVGDDATDNYAAITAAIAACPDAGVVLFPPGVYRISQPIVLDRPVTLQGTYAPRWSYSSSPRASLKPTNTFSGSAIVHVRDKSISGAAQDNNGGRIKNMTIDGNSYGTNITGIYFEGLVRDWGLEYVDISQTSGDGFRSEQGGGSGYPRGFTIEHMSIYSPAKHGFRAVALNDSYLEDVLVVAAALRGFYITSIGETKIIGSRAVFNALEGLYIDGSTLNGGVQFTDFSTDRNDRHGVLISATGTTVISFNGLLTRRDGKNDWGGTDAPYAGVAIIGTAGNKVAPVVISNLAQTPGIDDTGSGEQAPAVGVRVEYSEYVSIDGVLWGVNNAYVDNGNNDKLVIKENALLKVGYSSVTSSLYSSPSKWNVPSSGVISYTGGKVGIGTTAPQGLLDVRMASSDTVAQVFISDSAQRSLLLQSPRASDLVGRIGISGTAADLALGTRDFPDAVRIDNATGYVGFGTSSPTKPIHLSGPSTPSMRITDTTNNVTMDVRTDDYQAFIGTASNHDVRFMTNGASKAVLTTSGRFGIGTTSPSAQLHIDGSDPHILLGKNDATTPGGAFRVFIDDTNAVSETQAIKAINNRTSGLNYAVNGTAIGSGATRNVALYGWSSGATTNWGLWVDSGDAIFDGNVGIGTNAPTYKLDVAGTGRFTGDVTFDAGLKDKDGDSGTSGQFLSSTATGTDWVTPATALSEVLAIDDLTDAQKDTTNGNLFLGSAGFTGTFYNNYNTAVGIGAFDNANIDNTQTYYGNLNVAVGGGVLSDNTTGYQNTALGYRSLSLNTTGYVNVGVGVQSLYSNTTGTHNTAQGAYSLYSNTTGNSNTAQGPYALYANTTGRHNTAVGRSVLRLNTTGYENSALGVYALYGNTTGTYNIAVGSNAGRYIADGSTANTAGIYNIFLGTNTQALTSTDVNEIVIGYNATGLGSNTVTLGNDSITTTALKGNVGIGTTSPSKLLHLSGANSPALRITDTTNTVNAEFRSEDTLAFLGTMSNNDMRFMTNGSSRMTIGASGNVGIGTTSPSNNLHVYNAANGAGITMQGDRPVLKIDHTGNWALGGGIAFERNGVGQFEMLYDISNNELLFRGNGANHFTVEKAGNVIVGGTSSGGYKFYVNGSAYATGSWNSSDARWKKNVTQLQSALEKVTQLRGVTFDWRQEEYPNMNFADGTQIGFIAQEVEGIVPELVTTGTDGFKAVAYQNITALNVEAIKELNKKTEEGLALLTLRTDDNITTLSGLQESVDLQLATIDGMLTNIDSRLQSQNQTIVSLQDSFVTINGTVITLQSDLTQLTTTLAQVQETNTTILDFFTSLNPDTLLYTDTEGNLTLEGILTVEKIITEELETKKLTIADDADAPTVGTALIPAGETSVVVETEAVSERVNAFVSVRNVPVAVAATDFVEGESLRIVISEALEEDIFVNWWIVEAEYRDNDSAEESGSDESDVVGDAPDTGAINEDDGSTDASRDTLDVVGEDAPAADNEGAVTDSSSENTQDISAAASDGVVDNAVESAEPEDVVAPDVTDVQ